MSKHEVPDNRYDGPVATLAMSVDVEHDDDDNTVGLCIAEAKKGGTEDQTWAWMDPRSAFELARKIINHAALAAYGRGASAVICLDDIPENLN